jgi:short-subunit dehydrogenase
VSPPDQSPPPLDKVAIFGATSGIATAIGRRLAARGCRLVLIGRDAEGLASVAADLQVRGAREVAVVSTNFADLDSLSKAADAAWEVFDGLDAALVAYGTLPDQTAVQAAPGAAADAVLLNFTSPALLCEALATRFETQRRGVIAAITSVAGDRGRQSNYWYGSAKGGLQKFLEGLRHRLARAGVQVLDIRPGFVSTRMTAHLLPKGPLWASADKVADDIIRAIERRRAVLYTPWFWRGILGIVRALPRPLFHRTSL